MTALGNRDDLETCFWVPIVLFMYIKIFQRSGQRYFRQLTVACLRYITGNRYQVSGKYIYNNVQRLNGGENY